MMIRTSDQIEAISAALAKAQAKIENVGKDRENPHFRAKYATLAGVLDEVRPKLAEQGISLLQMPINGEGPNIGVVTRLLHSSGQWIESELFVAPTKFDAQGAGSVITYLRRYSAMAMTGIAPEDDDGEAAIGRPQGAQRAGMVRAADVPPKAATEPAPAPVQQRNPLAATAPDPNPTGQQAAPAAYRPSPEEPPEVGAARAQFVSQWWGRSDYGLNPEVIDGGMPAWDGWYSRLIEAAPSLDAHTKFVADNQPFYATWSKTVAPPVEKALRSKIVASERRLREREGAAA